ncbi:MAG: hypothetical protein KBA18_13585 [Kiritimatiellae bacterium]|nr:hypothetical protein [Kiritimatiellia bacterium]
MNELRDFIAALLVRIEQTRIKADMDETTGKNAHDLRTFAGGMESALKLAREFLEEKNDDE